LANVFFKWWSVPTRLAQETDTSGIVFRVQMGGSWEWVWLCYTTSHIGPIRHRRKRLQISEQAVIFLRASITKTTRVGNITGEQTADSGRLSPADLAGYAPVYFWCKHGRYHLSENWMLFILMTFYKEQWLTVYRFT